MPLVVSTNSLARIWEGEGYWRSEILNPINNDYWVELEESYPRRCLTSLPVESEPSYEGRNLSFVIKGYLRIPLKSSKITVK